jgi:GntR family transcriptional regulator
MKSRLDPSSPVPLYHQLAELLRYQMATGALAPGVVLPPLRQAAEQWGVNLHTVRHAYGKLAEAGLVQTTPPRGTIVLGDSRTTVDRSESAAWESVAQETTAREVVSPDHAELGPMDFIARVLREARERHGLSPEDVRRYLQRHAGSVTRTTQDVVHVIECSTSQALDLARQVEERWQVTAKPWSLERAGEPPAGTLVATYFHYNDIRARWPRRLAQVHFASIRPDPALAARIRAIAPEESRTTVILCERDVDSARNVAADLAVVLPSPSFDIRTLMATNPATALYTAGRTQPVLFPPRIWGSLGPAERADPRALEVRYLFDPAEIEAFGERFQWRARG